MDEWNDVIRPKVQGTWNLHEALGHHNLDFFVMFSSMCGLAGHFGQANYAAANTFLDAFTQYRQHLGLPASVIDIGVMEDVGSLTSTNPGALEPLRASAYWMLIERDLLESLELMICGGFPSSTEPPQSLTNDTAAAIMRGYTSRGQLGIGIRSTLPLCDPRNRVVWRRDRRMAVYWNDGGAGAADGGVSSSKNTGLSRFLTSVANDPTVLNNAEETAQTLTREIGRYLNDILGAAKDEDEDEQQLDPRMGLVELGVDSLIIIGLRNWLRQNLGVEVAVPEIVECVSVAELGRLAASRLKDKYDTALGGKQKSSA
jgi:aryl carrier-like protein